MPHLRFYAVDDDHRAVLDAVFGQGDLAVYERYSEPGRAIRRFACADEVPTKEHGLQLMLHVADAGGTPVLDGPPDAGGSVQIDGWGLIQVSFGTFFRQRELRWSFTNHNSPETVRKWEGTFPEGPSPHEWDFAAITRASGRLNRRIRKLAVDKIGAHPVLPAAADLIDRHQLRHVYGTGVHARPAGEQ